MLNSIGYDLVEKNLSTMKKIFKELRDEGNSEISTHRVIQKILSFLEPQYIQALHQVGTFSILHAGIGRALSVHAKTLRIQNRGKTYTQNIKGYVSHATLWRI